LRSVIPFNQDWYFAPEKLDVITANTTSNERFERVTIPHTNKLLPHHNFDDTEYQFISTYTKRFTLPEPLAGRRLFLDFEGAMTAATVSLNGQIYPEHKGGYVPFSFDITDAIREDTENLLVVQLDSTERTDIPPHGYVVDYLVFGGIYREVALRYVEPVYIHDVFVQPQNVLSDQPSLKVSVRIRNTSANAVTVDLSLQVAEVNAVAQVTSELLPNEIKRVEVELPAAPFELWSLEHPKRYSLETTLMVDTQPLDELSTTFGVRSTEFRDDGFYLNGERLQLFGLNRHQNYPYIGAAAPARLQRKDADILKYELGCNIVRTSHYPQSSHFLDRCDEIGLLVFEEIPGWQHIGDETWKALALRDVEAMIERDRNHPSIIIWGVRINESWDDHDFYTATNTLARQLDPTRPTGGVRYFRGSEWLEDVYTYNDFSNGILEPEQTPHLVTEFNGHMFPTKSFDNEERRVEHALRHTRVQSQAHMMGGVSGAIGWCAFDYNTHKEFGAGDRICYHGVMDIFRLPKFAAYFYESQQSPEQQIVLHAATGWQHGDVSEGKLEPIYVFSNCDRIAVFVGDTKQGEYNPAEEQFPGLPHPPFVIPHTDARLAQPRGDLHIVGYYHGEVVTEQKIAADGIPHALTLRADDETINADGADMTRLIFQIVDTYGNPLPYATAVVQFELEGDATLIGENPFPLVGGSAALYIKAGYQPSSIVIRASAPRLAPAEVRIRT
jgi:beta-galactosidase